VVIVESVSVRTPAFITPTPDVSVVDDSYVCEDLVEVPPSCRYVAAIVTDEFVDEGEGLLEPPGGAAGGVPDGAGDAVDATVGDAVGEAVAVVVEPVLSRLVELVELS